MSPRRGVDDAAGLTSVDLLEEIRAALDGLEPLLLGRMVDIEMPRLRVLTDPTLCRRLLAELIAYALAHSEPPDFVTVRVARTGKAARIEVVSEGGHATGHDLPDLTSAAEELTPDGTSVVNDANGNAVGGVRTVFVDVPTATIVPASLNAAGVLTSPCAYAGYQLNFSQQQLEQLYGTHGGYVSAVVQDAHQLEREHFLLSGDAKQLITDAAQSNVPTGP